MDLFFVHILGAIMVFTSYFYYIPKIRTKDLWAGMSSNLKLLFTISILIAVLSFLIGMWTGNDSKLKWAFLIFYLGASLWAPFLYYNNQLMVLVALCLTSLGAFLLTLWSPRHILFFIVLLHVLIMDNIIWYRNYSLL
jgi:hypothetical protein